MKSRKRIAVAVVLVVGFLAGWFLQRLGVGQPAPLAAPTLPSPPKPEAYNRGLSDAERETFYHLSEGGEIFPVDLLLALETETLTSDGSVQVRPFLDNIERYGLLSDPKSAGNPDGLPVGVSLGKSDQEGIDMIGLNCTACHVGQVQHDGHAMRIDGLGNMALINAFIGDMGNEFVATLKSPRRLLRFSKRVREVRKERRARGEEKNVVAQDEQILNQIIETATYNPGLLQQRVEVLMKGLPMVQKEMLVGTKEGYGRLDALGIGRDELFGLVKGATNSVPPNAPVSFPHIWYMQFTGWLQWGANTNSVMERNIAQALGVGASFDPETLHSTVKIENLHQLEQMVYKLSPPEWPASFGKIDQGLADTGKKLFVEYCMGCHETYTLDGVMRTYELFPLAEVGTDPQTAISFETNVQAANGDVTDFPHAVAGLVEGIKKKAYAERGYTAAQIASLEERQIRKGPQWDPQFRAPLLDSEQYNDTKGRKVYRSKSLVGIWATGPFLHNGSVPTIEDLLKPASQRPAKFMVGTREIDAEKLGIQTDPAKYRLAPNQTAFEFDTSLVGNYNTGHEWPSFYPELEKHPEQRKAIIEFLKTFTSETQLAGLKSSKGKMATIGPIEYPSPLPFTPPAVVPPVPVSSSFVWFVLGGVAVLAAIAWPIAGLLGAHGEAARATEDADIRTLTKNILTIQQRYAQEQNRPIARGTHAKGMAVRAELEVYDVFKTIPDRALAARLAQGIFATPGIYSAVARFANADSHIYPDPKADVRACSLAVEVPPGQLGASVSRQDFSMNNAPTFPINDVHEFAVTTEVAIAKTQLRGILKLPFADKFRFLRIFALAIGQLKPARTAFQQTRFWSTVPFHHGPADVAKYSLTPCVGNYAQPLSTAINCLQDELARHVNDDLQMSCFDFGVQLLEPDRMTYHVGRRSATFWIENASVKWNELQAPFYTVGRLTLTRKSVFPPDAVAKMYIDVTTNSADDCKPMGGINRARPVGEAASRKARLARESEVYERQA